MKFKTTVKQIKNGYGINSLYRVGYCDLQNLLSRLNPIAYTSGVYGWNFDLYDLDGVGITTGYRSMVGKQIPRPIIEKYEKLANEVLCKPFNYSGNKDEELNQLRNEFIKEIKEI